MPTDNEYLRLIWNQLQTPSPTPSPSPSGVAIAAGENHIGEVGGNLSDVSVSFTRPADTVAYAIGDVVGATVAANSVLGFLNASRTLGGRGYVARAVCSTDLISMPGQLRLHLFSGSPNPSVDNAAFAPQYTNNGIYEGYIDFTTFLTGYGDVARSVGVFSTVSALAYKTLTGTSQLNGMVQCINAWTPASGQRIDFRLALDRY